MRELKFKTVSRIFGILTDLAANGVPESTRRHDVSFGDVALRVACCVCILRRRLLRSAIYRAIAGGVVSFRRGTALAAGHAFHGRAAGGSDGQRQRGPAARV